MADDVTPDVNVPADGVTGAGSIDVSDVKDDAVRSGESPAMQDESIQKLVTAGIEEALRPIKENLNTAYTARDEALKRIAEYEQKERQMEIERLKDEGKHKEAFEKQLAEERSRREALEKRNVELTRDVELRSALNAHDFRNKNASEMAYKEIASELVRNEKDEWVHKTGVPISDYVTAFVSNDDNAFLMKQKVSNGTGSTATTSNPDIGSSKSLFDRPQSEVLKMAAEGKFSGGR